MTTNLVERPVLGSMVLSRLPRNPQPRAAWRGYLEVSKNAPAEAGIKRGGSCDRTRTPPMIT
jgi:hypothetical protein